MARLDDITIYFSSAKKIAQAPNDWKFAQLKNYVCDLYHYNLNGYKPPKTSRINVQLGSWVAPKGYATHFGSICTVHAVIDQDQYLANTDEQNYRYLLGVIHPPILDAAAALGWDAQVFINAYQLTLDSKFKYHVELPAKTRKNVGRFTPIIEKDQLTTYAYIFIETPVFKRKIRVFTKENISCHDNAALVAKKLKWFNDDQIGLELEEFNIRLCYTISRDFLESNLRFTRGNIYWEAE